MIGCYNPHGSIFIESKCFFLSLCSELHQSLSEQQEANDSLVKQLQVCLPVAL